jgi:SAM-dependent methyltransferase
MVAGEEYVAAITALESDRSARNAFQDLVLSVAPPTGCIFDFGAGPGIDARFYAERGFQVVAYDADPRMCTTFARQCDREIAAGRVHLCQGRYRDFIDLQVPLLRHQYAIDVVTANFAPLSLIDEPHELFATLHALTGSNATLVASVLNPWFVGDMRYVWWWANRVAYWRRGHFRVAGAGNNIFRRSLRNLASLAAPHFTLERVLRGLPGKAGVPRGSSGSLTLATSRYLFLVFAKR